MSNMIVQTKEKDIVRDINSMSLTNTNKTALEKYRLESKKAKEFEDVKNDVQEMKKMLSAILEKLNVS